MVKLQTFAGQIGTGKCYKHHFHGRVQRTTFPVCDQIVIINRQTK